MQTPSHMHGDIVIRPEGAGLTFVISSEPELTFVGQASKKKTWPRIITSTVVSLVLFSLPTLSRAATYSGSELVARTNAVRAERGLPALSVSRDLEQAAMAKANDMVANNYFGHYSPTGVSPWSFFKSSGYLFTAAGENLAADYVDGADIISAWMSSPTHRDNILNQHYRDIGLAVLDRTINGSPTTVVVQFFGSRQAIATPTVNTPKTIVTATAKPVTVQSTPASAKTQPSPAPAPVVTVVPIVVEEQPSLNVAFPAEVKGAATRVIPTLNLERSAPGQVDVRVIGLILATLGLYATVLTGAALMNGLLPQTKKEPMLAPNLILA